MTAATTSAGRLRSLGGGVMLARGVRRGGAWAGSAGPLGQLWTLRRTSRAARQFTSTCASPIRICVERLRPLSRIVPVWPAPDQVMTQLEVAVTV